MLQSYDSDLYTPSLPWGHLQLWTAAERSGCVSAAMLNGVLGCALRVRITVSSQGRSLSVLGKVMSALEIQAAQELEYSDLGDQQKRSGWGVVRSKPALGDRAGRDLLKPSRCGSDSADERS